MSEDTNKVEAQEDDMEQGKVTNSNKANKATKLTEAEMAKAETNFRKWLEEQKKVPIEIPEDPNNPDEVVPVGLNGVIYAIPRGKQFMVPEPIYKVWRNSHEATKKVNKKIKDTAFKEIEIM